MTLFGYFLRSTCTCLINDRDFVYVYIYSSFMLIWFISYHGFWRFWFYEEMGCVIGCLTEWCYQNLRVVVGLDWIFFFVKENPWKQFCEKFCWVVLFCTFGVLITQNILERERERERERGSLNLMGISNMALVFYF